MTARSNKAKPQKQSKPTVKAAGKSSGKPVGKNVKAVAASAAKAKSGKSLAVKPVATGSARKVKTAKTVVQTPAKAVRKSSTPVAVKPAKPAKLVVEKKKATKIAKPEVKHPKSEVKLAKPEVKTAVAKAPTKGKPELEVKKRPAPELPASPVLAKSPSKVAPVALPSAPPVRPQVVVNKHRSPAALRQILPPPPPPPVPKPERRPATAAALRAFEHAVKIFNRRQFEEAKELFEQLQQRFPHEGELLGRAQMYLQVCNQKVGHQAPGQQRQVTADELYDRGVYALNIGDFSQACSFFEKALHLNPNEPHFLYSLAVTHAQRGAHQEALDYLRRSIQIQPRFRAQAFEDADLSMLRENRQFQELLGLTSPFDLLESRR